MRAMRALMIVCLVACGSKSPTTKSPAPAKSAELSPALEPLAWWLGDWSAQSGSEHWVAAGGAIYGIALQDGAFEVMIVDDGDGRGKPDGTLRFIAMPGGAKAVEFTKSAADASSITFANEAHDYPKQIRYGRSGDALHAKIAGGDKSDDYHFKTAQTPRADALEAADIAFAKDTAARGIEGWVAAFDPKGAMMSKEGRVEGPDAIKPFMSPVLEKYKVAWAPIASAVRGDIGYTVGKATFSSADDNWRSSYVSIWKKQPDGSWKVIFDVGRPVQD
jgi:ketosteroid isomerase-like protein